MYDASLDLVPRQERERLALHQLAVIERATEKLAALLDCSAADAVKRAREVRRKAVDAL